MAAHEDPDDWELVNDDGFVYKRKKRPRLDPTAILSAVQPPPDPAAERRRRRERKRNALVKLRDKYVEEISRWEILSNTLKELEESAGTKSMERQELVCPTSSSKQHSDSDSSLRRTVDELLAQIEAQEAVIRSITNLCDVAEALCSAQEDRLKQQLTDLPIFDPSPQDLMAALGEQ
ncbi:uncharacterized protein LOC127242067 [Andrographis paniculata]|uniref:uncharacterized protein LOC127242067 n=1 Tax=Andrographis paniculata TaxID=175694 RepID=UPI0021E92B45|nr:uncharacterized protein LOC127242067 [Andrographis paniculata]